MGAEKNPTDAGGAKERKAFLVRLPPELHAELRRWASHELRSLNGQIEFLLREAVTKRRGKAPRASDGTDEAGGDDR